MLLAKCCKRIASHIALLARAIIILLFEILRIYRLVFLLYTAVADGVPHLDTLLELF